MPEDQGVNGDIWNDEAALLLKACGWQQIGDSNIDIVDDNDKKMGIDAIFKYEDARRNPRTPQAVFVESKCYKTDSYKMSDLRIWLNKLNDKVANSRGSEHFLDTYPGIRDCMIRNGLIVIWFSDLENYDKFRPSFLKNRKGISIVQKRNRAPVNMYVMDNYDILRIASMIKEIKEFNRDFNSELKFYYPTSDTFQHPVARSKYLSLDYMFSKIVLMEGKIDNIDHRVVFYFGELTMKGFERLKGLLNSISFMDKEKPLRIYRYVEDQEFRKILPDVENLFSEVECTLQEMDHYKGIPSFMKK